MRKPFFIFSSILLLAIAIIVVAKYSVLISSIPFLGSDHSSISHLPSGILLPTQFTQTSWKRYTSRELGVSFAYPVNKQLLVQEIPEQHLVDILYGNGYIFRITKVTTTLPLDKWLLENDEASNKYRDVTEYKTTFVNFPAVLAIETPEFAQNAQVPENTYYVKSNAKTLYQIEYAIPLARISVYPIDFTAEMKAANEAAIQEQNNLFRESIPQILGSVTFL